MKSAPNVLVLSPYRGPAAAERLRKALARQTWPGARLLLVGEMKSAEETVDAAYCPRANLKRELQDSSSEYVFFWPENVDLYPAAVEKFVLSLHLTPEQLAVADRARGVDAPWLARSHPALFAVAIKWLDTDETWRSELGEIGSSGFIIEESLTRGDDRRVTSAAPFLDLPRGQGIFEPVPEEPLWTLDPATTEPESSSVMIIIASLPMGGACKFILDLAQGLKIRGKRVTVVTTLSCHADPHPWLGEFLRLTDDVFILSHTRLLDLPRLAVHLARTRRCGQVLVTHSMLGYQMLPWMRAQLPGVTFADYVHIEWETACQAGGFALRSVNHHTLLDLSLVSSEHLRNWMIERGADPAKVRVCYTNIDTGRWKPDASIRAQERALLGIDDAETMILYPCRIVKQKRPEMLCSIIASLRLSTTRPFVVVVAGDGPLLPALRGFIKEHRLEDCVRTIGAVSLERVARLHAAADIFLLPSLIEGIALALFEAMALESVPVVSDVGGQREVITPECGHLVPLSHPAEELPVYVRALKTLVENPDQRRSMAVAARARVREHFQLRSMVEGFLAAMEEADTNRIQRPVRLPDATFLREIVTLALDYARMERAEGLNLQSIFGLIQRVDHKDKIIEKLQRKSRELRADKAEPSIGSRSDAEVKPQPAALV